MVLQLDDIPEDRSDHNDGNSNSANKEDPFKIIENRVLEELVRRGGKAEYSDMENWAENNGIGKYTLRTVINDIIEDGKLRVPEGYFDSWEELEPPAPKVIEITDIPMKDLEKMKEYLKEYWSVGLLRLFDDLNKSGMNDVNEVLKALTQEGYAQLAGASVVNATGKLLKDTKPKGSAGARLSDLVKF